MPEELEAAVKRLVTKYGLEENEARSLLTNLAAGYYCTIDATESGQAIKLRIESRFITTKPIPYYTMGAV